MLCAGEIEVGPTNDSTYNSTSSGFEDLEIDLPHGTSLTTLWNEFNSADDGVFHRHPAFLFRSTKTSWVKVLEELDYRVVVIRLSQLACLHHFLRVIQQQHYLLLREERASRARVVEYGYAQSSEVEPRRSRITYRTMKLALLEFRRLEILDLSDGRELRIRQKHMLHQIAQISLYVSDLVNLLGTLFLLPLALRSGVV